mgnify:FL=1
MNKKAQEEMVGFVLIVVLVSVILLVLLAIIIRKPAVSSQSLEVGQFLDSMLEYTTKCAIGYEPRYASVGELMGYCYDGKMCTSGKNTCDVLNESVNELVSSAWLISSEGYYTGYSLNSVYAKNDKTENILKIYKGNCTIYRGADTFFEHQGGVIDVTMRVCTS